MANQTPKAQIAERVAETAPGLAAAAHAEAVQQLRRMNHDFRTRLADSHRWQAEAVGMPTSENPGGDAVGNLIVTGDIYGSDSADIIGSLNSMPPTKPQPQTPTPQPQTPTPQPQTPTPQPSIIPTWMKVGAVILALEGAGGLGALAASYFSKPSTVSTTDTSQPNDVQLGVEVVEGGATR